MAADYAAYVDKYPDLAKEYQVRGQQAFGSKEAYGKWHWENYASKYPGRREVPQKETEPTSTFDFQSILDSIAETTQGFQQQIADQQAVFQTQLAEQQRQAQEAQRQLMISMQRADRAPAAVKTASSGAEQSGLTSRGTTGYFGRRGMRIGSLNVPSTGLAIMPNMQTPTSGSFA